MTAPSRRRWRPPRPHHHATHLWAMQLLTFSTGVVDAVGYLGLDRVFTGNMTGNVVILGMALAGDTGLPVLGPALALVFFMLGAVVGGRFLRPVGRGWTWRTDVAFGVVAAVMAVITVVLLATTGGDVPDDPYAVTAALAAAMGLQAATARRLSVQDVTTVVVTSTITGLASDSWLGGRTGQPWVRRASAVTLIGAGALVGALTLQVGIALGIGLAAALTVLATVLGALLGREPAEEPAPPA